MLMRPIRRGDELLTPLGHTARVVKIEGERVSLEYLDRPYSGKTADTNEATLRIEFVERWCKFVSPPHAHSTRPKI